MKFSITRQGGQYQFWHTDCEKSRSGILDKPEFLDNNIKRFKCLHCGKSGVVEIDKIVTGNGTLFEAVSPELKDSVVKLTEGDDIDIDAPLSGEDE